MSMFFFTFCDKSIYVSHFFKMIFRIDFICVGMIAIWTWDFDGKDFVKRGEWTCFPFTRWMEEGFYFQKYSCNHAWIVLDNN